MTKTKKIIIGVIILAVAVCAVFVTLFEIGFFEKSNYKFLNYDKYVKVGKYKGLKYTAKKVSVTQKEIDQEITSRRTSAQTQKSVKSGTLAKGDVANISYEFTFLIVGIVHFFIMRKKIFDWKDSQKK